MSNEAGTDQSTSADISRENGSSESTTHQEAACAPRQSLSMITGYGIAPVRAHLKISCHTLHDSAIDIQREPELDLVVVHLFQKEAGDTENSHKAFFECVSDNTRRSSGSRRNSIHSLSKSISRRETFELDTTSKTSETLDDAQSAVLQPSKTLWLQDGLLKTLPLSRVICMGFCLDSTPRNGDNDLVDFEAASQDLLAELNDQRSGSPTRPLVILGHLYGCHILQKAMERLSKPQPQEGLMRFCAGILSLGIPDDDFDPPMTDQNFATNSSARRLEDSSKKAAILYSNLDQELRRGQKSPHALPTNDRLLRLIGTRAILWSQTHALFSAIVQGQFVTVRDLIQAGVDVNQMRDAHLMTALHLACRTKSTRPHDIDLLIQEGNADVTLKDDQGRTALHYAVEMTLPDIEIARSLLGAGAQVYTTDSLGVTPWKLASANKEGMKICELLRKPPLVQGPSASANPTPFKQPHSQIAKEACDCFQMIATEMFINSATMTEKHLSRYFSVNEAIYGKTNLEQRLDETRSSSVTDELVCRWYHLPANNMAWVEDLFRNRFQTHSWRWSEQFRDSKWPHGRCINTHAMQYAAESGESVLALCLPYVSYEDNVNRSSMSAFIKEEMQSSPAQPMVGNRASEVGLRRKDELSFRAYLQHSSPLHVRRTLDQWLYYMLPDTRQRDTDQVVTRWARDWLGHPRHNILMVDQLWLWVVKGEKTKGRPDTVISCFPDREGHESGSLDDLQRSVLNRNVENRYPIVKTADLVSKITATCCGVFEWTSESELVHFYEIFAATVGRASDQETQLLQGFKRRSEELHLLSEKYRYHWKEKNRLLKELLDIRPQTRLLEEVRDVCDEIDIILHVSREQRRALESNNIGAFFDQQLEPQTDVTFVPLAEKPLQPIRQTIANFKGLQQQIKDVQAGLKDLLDLQQKQATVWEARSIRDRALSASKQGNVMVVFTTVTIIFLPLSFMAALFAISSDLFPKRATVKAI